MRSFLLFSSVRHAIKAEQFCQQQAIECRVLPVPRKISSECGMCLEVEPVKAASALTALQAAEFDVSLAELES